MLKPISIYFADWLIQIVTLSAYLEFDLRWFVSESQELEAEDGGAEELEKMMQLRMKSLTSST